MFIPVVIGIMWFFLAVFPTSLGYYQVPVSITGKVYANSMLVLICSQVPLGSEEMPPTVVSAMIFCTASTNIKDSAIEVLESRSTFLYLHSLVSLFVKMSPGPKL